MHAGSFYMEFREHEHQLDYPDELDCPQLVPPNPTDKSIGARQWKYQIKQYRWALRQFQLTWWTDLCAESI